MYSTLNSVSERTVCKLSLSGVTEGRRRPLGHVSTSDSAFFISMARCILYSTTEGIYSSLSGPPPLLLVVAASCYSKATNEDLAATVDPIVCRLLLQTYTFALIWALSLITNFFSIDLWEKLEVGAYIIWLSRNNITRLVWQLRFAALVMCFIHRPRHTVVLELVDVYLSLGEEDSSFSPLGEGELHGFGVGYTAGWQRRHVAHVHAGRTGAHQSRYCNRDNRD